LRQRGTVSDQGCESVAHRFEHLDVGREVGIRRRRAVAGHDDRVALDALEDAAAKLDDAVEVAAVVDVGERIGAGQEDVARVHDVAAAQDDRDVAGRVRGRDVHELEALVAEVELDAIFERDDGQSARRKRRLLEDRPYDVDLVVVQQHRACVRMRDDQRVGAEHLVAFGMVVVPMRVDDVRDGATAQALDRLAIFRHVLRITRVDDERTAGTEQHQNVAGGLAAAGAVEDVQPGLQLLRRCSRLGRGLLRHRAFRQQAHARDHRESNHCRSFKACQSCRVSS
jgi:hypothetical protein